MILEKVIPQTAIPDEYQDLVDRYISQVRTEFQGQIHSIYMCGSIPKGTAVPFKSDADFTLVCANPEEIDHARLSKIKDALLEAYPIVTKIDTTICSIDDVVSKPNEWGFWVKVICVCVQGPDVGERVPPIEISPTFILELNTDTPEEVARIRRLLTEADDPVLRARYLKGCAKRLLRALYSLILEETGVWEDDMAKMKDALLASSKIDPALVAGLYAGYLDSKGDVEAFLRIADEAYREFERALHALASH